MKKALGYLQKIQIAAGGIFLCIFLGSVVIQMACRYAGAAAIWIEDVSMYAFIWESQRFLSYRTASYLQKCLTA